MAEPVRLDQLEPEILTMIMEYVDDTSRQTSLSVALTCKYFASVMKRISYRHKTLRIRGDDRNGLQSLPDIITKWSNDEAFLVNVRALTVDGHLPAFPQLEETLENEDLWKPLIELFSNISRLRLLTWNLAAIPIPVLDAFHKHQTFAKLRLFKYQPSVGLQPSARDRALAKSPALTHLRSVLTPLATFPDPNMQETAFRRIVALAPLEYAGIVNHIGDPVAGEPQRKVPFRTSRKPNASIKFLTLDGYNMSKETFEDWSSIIDLTALESVKCSRGFPDLSYFENAASILPNLKHISLNLRQLVEIGNLNQELVTAVRNYLQSCPPLETLSLWTWMELVDLEGILNQHGPTLKSLQLHERETGLSPRRTLSVDQLKNILSSCPHLREFTFDLDRQDSELAPPHEDSNMDYLTLLADSKLNYLQIYFDTGLKYLYSFSNHHGETDSEEEADDETADGRTGDQRDGSNRSSDEDLEPEAKRFKRFNSTPKPYTEEYSRSYVESIWKKVFGTSTTARKLDVKFGEWESITSRSRGVFTTRAIDERRHSSFCMARPAERDDQKGQCTVTVKKP